MMIAGNTLQFPIVSDNSAGLAWRLSFDFWHLPRSERACSKLPVNRDHGDASLGCPPLPRSSFPDSLLPAFVHATSATKTADAGLHFSSYGSFEPSDRFDLKLAAVRARGSSSAARDNRSGSQNHLVDERLQGDAGANQQAAPALHSDEELRSSQAGLGNAGQGAINGGLEEDILLQEARYRALHLRALNSDAEEWKSLARGTAVQQAFPQVPNRQLMKIAELRVDNDAQEEGLGDRKTFPHMRKRADGKRNHPVIHHNQTSEGSKAFPQTATGNYWTFAEVKSLPAISNSFWGKVGITVLIAGALFIMIQLISSMEGSSRRHSVKRRIIRSQWYGNSGPQILPRRDFKVRRSEFLRYPILEVDGDKKTFRFPFHASHARKPNSEGSDQWASETKASEPLHGRSAGADSRAQHSKELAASKFTPKRKGQSPWTSNEKASSASEYIAPAEHKLTGSSWSNVSLGQESDMVFSQHKLISADDEPSASASPMRWSVLGGTSRRENLAQPMDMKEESEQKLKMDDTSLPKIDGKSEWQEEDELDLDRRIRKLRYTVQAVEQHRRAALLALAEERQRSMELEEEINRQREAATTLEKEVQLLKESHEALLTSLRKKYSSSAAARAAADLIYQDWESDDGTSVSEAVAK